MKRTVGWGLAGVATLLVSATLWAAPLKPAVSIEIRTPARLVGVSSIRLEIIAKMPVRSIDIRAYLDKVPVNVPPQPMLSLSRGDRRSVDFMMNVPDGKEHWLYVEAEATLPAGERVTAGKSLQINASRKGQKPDTYETYRSEKPQKK